MATLTHSALPRRSYHRDTKVRLVYSWFDDRLLQPMKRSRIVFCIALRPVLRCRLSLEGVRQGKHRSQY
jgi:hypothetical protein